LIQFKKTHTKQTTNKKMTDNNNNVEQNIEYSESDSDYQPSSSEVSTPSAETALLNSIAQSISYESVGKMKLLQHQLHYRRKNANLVYRARKNRLHRTMMNQRRKDSDAKSLREAQKPMLKRERELVDYEHQLEVEHRAKMLGEQYEHEALVRECEIELKNRSMKIDMRNDFERAQKKIEIAEAAYQARQELQGLNHELHMARMRQTVEKKRMRLELVQKYGAKLGDEMFE
jgi:hypothetical protein